MHHGVRTYFTHNVPVVLGPDTLQGLKELQPRLQKAVQWHTHVHVASRIALGLLIEC